MKRPHIIWLAFAACVAVGFGVLAWFSSEMLRLDRIAGESQQLAAREEAVRLALWRMDSALAGVHGLEAARPAQDYEPFHPLDQVFSPDLAPLAARSVWVPSPLLQYTPPFVRLHFQVEAGGRIQSPQSPPPEFRAAALAAGAARARLDEAREVLARLTSSIAPGRLFAVATRQSAAPDALAAERDDAAQDAPMLRDAGARAGSDMKQQAPVPEAVGRETSAAPIELTGQQEKNVAEQRQREELYVTQSRLGAASALRSKEGEGSIGSLYRPEVSRPLLKKSAPAAASSPPRAAESNALSDGVPRAGEAGRASADETIADAREAIPERPSPTASAFAADGAEPANAEAGLELPQHPLRAVWADGELFFVREALIGGRSVVQGAWLDWPEIEAWLLSRISDLLPQGRLTAVDFASGPGIEVNGARRLAFLPVSLLPGPLELSGGSSWSPLRISLGTAWVSAAMGAVALGLLLLGTLRLSERRGAFVSAVTHELRTPLTTFRMYTEMLSSGMVADEQRRRSYIDTLRKESERLAHLVENVLSYSRIERGRAASQVEDTTPGKLVSRMEERLCERLSQGEMTLCITIAPDVEGAFFSTDSGAVEQVIFNLVDNATKYGRPAGGGAGGEVALEVGRFGRDRVAFRVVDPGPGLPVDARKRLFQPFSKSAHEAAAQSQPGVGLGLALCRRLAREELGGELVLERNGPGGTVFRLELPIR